MILESVPNFSEGRRRDVCDSIADSARREGAQVLDLEMDKDHNRSVLTLIGSPETVALAAFAAAKKAVELVDLNHHQGEHPRMGAIDVLPFVPLRGATMDDAVRVGGLPGIKALGLSIPDRKCAQVSINVCDYTCTGLLAVFQAVETEADRLGAKVRSSEVIGLLPQAALPGDPERTLKLSGFSAK